MPNLKSLDNASGLWQETTKSWDDILQTKYPAQAQILYVSSEEMLGFPNRLRTQILDDFKVPPFLLDRLCLGSNGFCGSGPVLSSDGHLEAYNHWSRFLVKQTYKTLRRKRSFIEYQPTGVPIHGPKTIPNGWEWFEMTFFVHWRPPQSTTIICFDTPEKFQSLLASALKLSGFNIDYIDPYSLFATVIDQLLAMYDTSVWSMRNHVCTAEATRHQDSDYPLLHEVARHMIHVSETLAVAHESVEGLGKQQIDFMIKQSPCTSLWNSTQDHLQFQNRMLRSLLQRSESNKARLQNEITLAFNAAAQRDNELQAHIGQEVKKETAAMKAIAVSTLTFLPATFVSSLFSMSFFNYQPASDGDKEAFTVSDKFWVYWALAVPLFFMTLLLWVFWEGTMIKRRHGH